MKDGWIAILFFVRTRDMYSIVFSYRILKLICTIYITSPNINV